MVSYLCLLFFGTWLVCGEAVRVFSRSAPLPSFFDGLVPQAENPPPDRLRFGNIFLLTILFQNFYTLGVQTYMYRRSLWIVGRAAHFLFFGQCFHLSFRSPYICYYFVVQKSINKNKR